MVYISQVTENTINVLFVRLESYSIIYLSNELQNNNKYINQNATISKGKAFARMSAQSVAHLLMVIFIILGNLSYYYERRRG